MDGFFITCKTCLSPKCEIKINKSKKKVIVLCPNCGQKEAELDVIDQRKQPPRRSDEAFANALSKTKVCLVEGCNEPYRTKGYCASHYRLKLARGEIGKLSPLLQERLDYAVDLLKENPELTYVDIGEKCGVAFQSISELFRRAGITKTDYSAWEEKRKARLSKEAKN